MKTVSKSGVRYSLIFIALFISLIVIFGVSIGLGSVKITFCDVFKILLGNANYDIGMNDIVWNIRFPRAVGALLSGAALASAGILLQIFFKNPIVEPFVLGISSGAVLFVAIVSLGVVSLGFSTVSPMIVFLAALTGAFIVTSIVVSFAGRVKSIVTLLVIGLMVGYICSALTNVMVTLAEKEQIQGFMIWTMGSFSGFTWENIKILLVMGIPALISLFFIIKPLNALLMGEEYAGSMGVNIRLFRTVIVLLASVLAALVTAFAGPVSFIGLAVPHITRLIFGTADNKILVPGTILMGALITTLCDLVARTLLSPTELPISAVTTFIGAPIVIILILKRRTSL